ncbi:phosphotransferase [Paenibacillus hubeiensis]|uniref:phosphotransferase n=1 Tax=Paenibacillus hubeiensis TaxID=3077330 RepID=UPI0031BB2863
MTHEQLMHLLHAYEMDRPEPTFLRHNENRTYRVQDSDGKRYLLRIHEPFVQEMKGLQHTEAGILAELDMLEQWGQWSRDEVQVPVRNKNGELVTTFETDGQKMNASLLTWMEGRDLSQEDVQDADIAKKLGKHMAELHAFFRQYNPSGMEARPSQGKAYNKRMAQVIHSSVSQVLLLEGLTLAAIIGFYVFQIGNEKHHDGMRERMPILCAERCRPFLRGERIFYQ